jgi:uncharacterized DUF497 family protein
MFDLDRSNLRKIRAHRIEQAEVEQALINSPIPIYEQDIEGEWRFVYYGETDRGRLLAVIVTERGRAIRVITSTISTQDKNVTTSNGGRKENESMSRKTPEMPKFRSQSEEADWWASPEGRDYVKRKASASRLNRANVVGSRLVRELGKKASVQIAIRLPEADLKQAREIAGRKGIGYQTLLKMFVHEGLRREARRR